MATRENPDGRHFRAARAWFRLGRERVAAGAGLNDKTIEAIERDAPGVKVESHEKLRAYYARCGVLFLLAEEGGGFRVIGTGPRTVGVPGEPGW